MPEGEGTYGNQVGRPPEEDRAVDLFMDEATASEQVDLAQNQNLSEAEVREAQAGLNLLATVFPKDNAELLKVDGVFGPKTYNRFKKFYVSLPKSTQKKLPAGDNPLMNVDGKVV
jgi:hypothetical protein